jgi:hypothetical protein
LANKKYPGIPAVTTDRDLAASVRVVIENVELLTGQRGSGDMKSVTAADFKAFNDKVAAAFATLGVPF